MDIVVTSETLNLKPDYEGSDSNSRASKFNLGKERVFYTPWLC
jgi:hypothetical protein